MMTRRALFGVLLLGLGTVACKPNTLPGSVVTLYAQTLPITRTLAWDPPTSGCAAPDGPCTYRVRLDGAQVAQGLTVQTQAVTFTASGVHTLSVTATNIWLEGAAATLTVNVIGPAAPANPRLQ